MYVIPADKVTLPATEIVAVPVIVPAKPVQFIDFAPVLPVAMVTVPVERLVKNTSSATDVKQRIESALRRHAEVDAKNIAVDADHGCVTLRGRVRSWAEREDAERAAWSAPGVTQVKDELLVSI